VGAVSEEDFREGLRSSLALQTSAASAALVFCAQEKSGCADSKEVEFGIVDLFVTDSLPTTNLNAFLGANAASFC
jgi:hypothetical protein